MPLRALLFDVDGTLAETERDGHRIAFNRAFTDEGLDWHWDESLYGELLQVAGGRERIDHFVAKFGLPRPADSAALHARKNRHYAELVAMGSIQPRAGLRDLLNRARTLGLQLGIVTTTSRNNVIALLSASIEPDIREAFSILVTSEDVTRKKPSPECYSLALDQLGLPACDALAVEDSRNGLESALGAGLDVVIIRSHYFRHEVFREALAVVDAFDAVDLEGLSRSMSP